MSGIKIIDRIRLKRNQPHIKITDYVCSVELIYVDAAFISSAFSASPQLDSDHAGHTTSSQYFI